MSKNNFFRKRIKPVIDEDDERRNISGRKRVDVIECLLDSSTDENEDINNSNPILWLTLTEISHIRSILAQTTLSTLMFNKDKQYSKILHGYLCFRCRKPMNLLFFLPTFISSTNCYICKQKICKKCSLSNFIHPLTTRFFPVRAQALISSSLTSIQNETNYKNKINTQTKSMCYDCSQIFDQCTKFPQKSIKTSVSETHQSFFSFTKFNIRQYI